MEFASFKAILATSSAAFSLILSLTVGIIFAYTRFRVPAHTDESNPIVEEIGELVEEMILEENLEDAHD